MESLNDYAHLFFCCRICGKKVKLAKNKGSYWKTGYPQLWLEDFLVQHGDCGFADLYICGER